MQLNELGTNLESLVDPYLPRGSRPPKLTRDVLCREAERRFASRYLAYPRRRRKWNHPIVIFVFLAMSILSAAYLIWQLGW